MNEQTFYIYMEVKTSAGADFARLCMTNMIRDLILSLYVKHKLEYEFYSSGMAFSVERWLLELIQHEDPTLVEGRTIYVFRNLRGHKARRILFSAGDGFLNKLSGSPVDQMNISDIIYNLVGKKGNETVEPLIFSDGDRFANLFELKNVP